MAVKSSCSELDNLLGHHERIRLRDGLLPGSLVIKCAAMLVAVPVQRAVDMPAPALESRKSYPLPARSAPIGRRQARLRGARRTSRLRCNYNRGGNYSFLVVTRGLRRLYQHTLSLRRPHTPLFHNSNRGRTRSHSRTPFSRNSRRLRVHHQITITLRAKPHRRLTPEETANVLAHHRPRRSLRCRLLRYTLCGHL